jgi:hypothetical protein
MKPTLCLAAVLTLALASTGVSQTPASPKHHVLFQVTAAQGAEWEVLPIHLENLRAAFEKDGGVQVEVVFYGAGVTMLRKGNAPFEARLKKMADEGVTLAACQNAMRMMNLKTEDLFPFTTQVDAGVAEVARKQEAGWAFIP